MVDREGRDEAAAAVRDFMEGSITNDEYENRFPLDSDDPALHEIYWQLWFLYSDISTHKLTGRHALKEHNRALLERCVLFLRSDLEYQWPKQQLGFRNLILWLLGQGRKLEEKFDRCGDSEVWPFLKKAEYESFLASTLKSAD